MTCFLAFATLRFDYSHSLYTLSSSPGVLLASVILSSTSSLTAESDGGLIPGRAAFLLPSLVFLLLTFNSKMSDILTMDTPNDSASTTSASKSDVDWTVVGSTPTSPSQSATSPSPPLSSRPSIPSEEVATITPSSPAQSLVESDDAKLQSLSSLATNDLISPIATPLPASPVDKGQLAEGTEVSTPVDSEWARSKLGISEGEDDGKSSIEGSDTKHAVGTEKEKEGERKAEEEKGDESKDVRAPKEDEVNCLLPISIPPSG